MTDELAGASPGPAQDEGAASTTSDSIPAATVGDAPAGPLDPKTPTLPSPAQSEGGGARAEVSPGPLPIAPAVSSSASLLQLALPFLGGLALVAAVLAPVMCPDAVRRVRARLRFGVEPSPGGLVLELEPLSPKLITALDRGPGAAGAGDSNGPWFLLWIVNTGAQATLLAHADRPGEEVSVEVIPRDGQAPPDEEVPPPGWSPTSEAKPLSTTWLAPDGRLGLPLDLGPWFAGRTSGRYWVVVTRTSQGDPRVGLDGPARSARTAITVHVR